MGFVEEYDRHVYRAKCNDPVSTQMIVGYEIESILPSVINQLCLSVSTSIQDVGQSARADSCIHAEHIRTALKFPDIMAERLLQEIKQHEPSAVSVTISEPSNVSVTIGEPYDEISLIYISVTFDPPLT